MLLNENDVETVALLINQNARAKNHIEIGIDAEDYYKIKDAAGRKNGIDTFKIV